MLQNMHACYKWPIQDKIKPMYKPKYMNQVSTENSFGQTETSVTRKVAPVVKLEGT